MVPGLEGDRDRQKFVIKVYSLIIMMLGLTTVWSILVMTNISLLLFVFTNIWLWYICAVVSIVIMCAIICRHEHFRKVPANYLALLVYTITHAYFVAGIIPQYETEAVICAALCTTAMFFGLTMYACFTKTDMTKKGGVLATATMMLFMFIILFFPFGFGFGFLRIAIVIVIVILMSAWVVHDTQLIIGGKKKYKLDKDDYILGAMIIYIDVMTIFLYLLQLFGGSR